MTELKPCPFCGQSVSLGYDMYGAIKIYCPDYHYFFLTDERHFAYTKGDEQKVIDAWNTRYHNEQERIT